jgi:hypothetical protein
MPGGGGIRFLICRTKLAVLTRVFHKTSKQMNPLKPAVE